jgi:hypothetical protein
MLFMPPITISAPTRKETTKHHLGSCRRGIGDIVIASSERNPRAPDYSGKYIDTPVENGHNIAGTVYSAHTYTTSTTTPP